jgi:hypothetical protein
MSRITARDAQVFVGGAFAFEGFHALRIPHTMAIDGGQSFVIGDVIGAFGLPLGVAILFKNIFAVRVALVYLWLDVLITCVFLVLLLYKSELQNRGDFILRDTVIIVTGQVVLLGLLFWSDENSDRNHEAPAPNQAMERTADRCKLHF